MNLNWTISPESFLNESISSAISEHKLSAKSELRKLWENNSNEVTFAHLNINSIQNTFEQLAHIIKGIVDILMISESKLDDSFPVSQFLSKVYCAPFRLDQKKYGDSIMLFVRKDISLKLILSEKLAIKSF